MFETEEITLDCDTAKYYLAEIVLGIQDLHDQGIIHRDIKPGNILIEADGHIKLTDYGLSDIESRSKCENKALEVKGSLNFMAPENFEDDEHLGFEVDWWAMGVLAFFMVKERFPFDGDTKEEMIKQIVKRNIKWEEEDSNSNSLGKNSKNFF